MSRAWAWLQTLGGLAILAVLVWRVGTGPFVDGVSMIDARSTAAVVVISGVTTVACAWRWQLVAKGLGAGMPLPAGVAAYYRSQFLNSILPGGVLGDAHRGWRHGRDSGDVGRGVLAVVWERVAGQVVQVLLAVLVLLWLPSPVSASRPVLVAGTVVFAAVAVVLGGPLVRRVWSGVVLASALAVAGHVTVFLIAARVAGTDASVKELLPLAMLVLVAMSVPTNIAGWGPREGMAAWAFSAAALGAAQGVATAVVYGVMSFVACLPGAVVLLGAWWMRGQGTGSPEPVEEGAVHA